MSKQWSIQNRSGWNAWRKREIRYEVWSWYGFHACTDHGLADVPTGYGVSIYTLKGAVIACSHGCIIYVGLCTQTLGTVSFLGDISVSV